MDAKDKKSKRNKEYWAKNKDAINARRNAKARKPQDANLVALITDYVEGLTIKELCDKYRVNIR